MSRPIREDEKKSLWELLLKGEKKDSKNGYVRFMYKGVNHTRSRILYQLYHGVILYDDEVVHHIDKNKRNDSINNLKMMTSYEHLSEHAKDRRKKHKEKIKSNKLINETINKIFKLKQEQIDNKEKINYSKIARELGISSQTVRNYTLKIGKKNG